MDKGEKHFAEDGGPLLMVGGREFGGEKCMLEPGEGLVPDFTAGIDTLGAHGAEDGGPVSCPSLWVVSKKRRLMAIGNTPSFLSR